LRTSITGEIVMDEVFVPERSAARRRGRRAVRLSEQRALRHRLGALGAAEFCWRGAPR
jgi:hypothetical protein